MECFCWKCGHKNETDKVFRDDICSKCKLDLKCCKNCTFYDESHYNQCRENQAERVVEKEKANFCDYFLFRNGFSSTTKSDNLSKLNDLFKK